MIDTCPICKAPLIRINAAGEPVRTHWCRQCGSLSDSNPILVPVSYRENERLRAALQRMEGFCRDLIAFTPGGATGAGLLAKLDRLREANKDLLT